MELNLLRPLPKVNWFSVEATAEFSSEQYIAISTPHVDYLPAEANAEFSSGECIANEIISKATNKFVKKNLGFCSVHKDKYKTII